MRDVRASWLGQCPLADMRISAVDPGTTDWIYAAEQGDCYIDRRTWLLSTSCYYEKCGFTQRKRWQEKKLHAAPNDLEVWQSAIPTTRTAYLATWQQYVWGVTRRLREILRFYWQRQMRSRRWQASSQLTT